MKPFVRRGWRHLSLQFTRDQTESRMLRWRPDALLVDYTRSMLAALLWQPQPHLVGMIGLGGGSQAKFCHRHLPQARIEVAEIDPDVIALRREFRIPDDDARLRVYREDGARFLRDRRGRYDLLLVDGYDAAGLPEALSTQAFYDDCRGALAYGGAAAFNLYCPDPAPHLERLRRSFGDRLLAVQEPKMANLVAFAWDPRAPAAGVGPEAAAAALTPAGRRQLARELARIHAALADTLRPPA